jgi:hypothetical protein
MPLSQGRVGAPQRYALGARRPESGEVFFFFGLILHGGQGRSGTTQRHASSQGRVDAPHFRAHRGYTVLRGLFRPGISASPSATRAIAAERGVRLRRRARGPGFRTARFCARSSLAFSRAASWDSARARGARPRPPSGLVVSAAQRGDKDSDTDRTARSQPFAREPRRQGRTSPYLQSPPGAAATRTTGPAPADAIV